MFDLLCYNLQISILNNNKNSIGACRKRIQSVAENLSIKTNIPAIAKEIELIDSILTEDYWTTISVIDAENIRRQLEKSCEIDRQSRKKNCLYNTHG